jgi:NDP-sugar pyrophosphorylase family protein
MAEVPEYLKPEYYFSSEGLEKYKELFEGINFVWEAIPRIEAYVKKRTEEAYLRQNVIIGDNCIFRGEAKNSLMMDNSAAAHWPYMGDSIIGSNVNLGARTTLSNLKVKPSNVKLKIEGEIYDTGLSKLGAIMGDKVSTGCHAETNPGTLIGPDVMIYPTATIGPGLFKANHIIKYKPGIDVVKKVERK